MRLLLLSLLFLLTVTNAVRLQGVSVSGVSSGGYMAVQLHVAHSSIIVGSGTTAGGPYWCSEGNVEIALTSCSVQPDLISIDALIAATIFAEDTLSIDATSNLAKSQVWLFSGISDTIVYQGVMKKLESYFSYYISSANIKSVFNINAEHSWVTNNYGNPCRIIASPFINNCDFDSAGDLLSWIYGNLNPKTMANISNLYKVSQKGYTPLSIDPSLISMGPDAYFYIPSNCTGGQTTCAVHVALHGCEQSVSDIGTTFVIHSGLNEWAESNDIVILYPQTQPSPVFPYNPKSCWDWWGYTGGEYATKLAPQIITIKNMIDSFSNTK